MDGTDGGAPQGSKKISAAHGNEAEITQTETNKKISSQEPLMLFWHFHAPDRLPCATNRVLA